MPGESSHNQPVFLDRPRGDISVATLVPDTLSFIVPNRRIQIPNPSLSIFRDDSTGSNSGGVSLVRWVLIVVI
jgi:hypothetical protein